MGNKSGHHDPSVSHEDQHNAFSKPSPAGPPPFAAIPDRYKTLDELQNALRDAGMEVCELIIGIDYTISNKDQGKRSFGGKSLHAIGPGIFNPYQSVITIMGRTLEPFDTDHMIPAFGFGDKFTKDKTIAPFINGRSCHGFQEVLQRYNEITPQIELAGPTSFAPLIREATRIAAESRSYHILLIIADGQVTPDTEWCSATRETITAIVEYSSPRADVLLLEASHHPLSIVVVGVGDGPWDMMAEFDDGLPQRQFDNFQFVEFNKAIVGSTPQQQEINFAVAALQEIPEQYFRIKKLGLI